ncbi:MAG: GumC domain-containing protein [Planctomycetota bacterium]
MSLLLAVGGAALIVLNHRPEYRATAWLATKRYEPTIVGPSARDFGGDPTGYITTQGQIIRSPIVLSKASAKLKEEHDIKELEDQSDPENWLLTRLEARWDGHSLINTVSFTCGDPEHAKTIVNTIVNTYLQLRKEWDRRSADILIDILNREHLRHAEQVKALREQVSDQAELLKIKDPFSPRPDLELSAALAESPLADLHSQLVSAGLERKVLQTRIEAAEQTSDDSVTVSSREIEVALDSHPLVVGANNLITQKQIELLNAEITAESEEDQVSRSSWRFERGCIQKLRSS